MQMRCAYVTVGSMPYCQRPVLFFDRRSRKSSYKFGWSIAAIIQSWFIMEPLPNLRSADFCRCRIFHEIVDSRGAIARQPAFEV